MRYKGHMHWKVSRDPFYRELKQEQIEEAGFFMDSASVDRDVLRDIHSLVCWPRHVALSREQLGTRGKRAILLLTGCFAPIHAAHVSILEAAKTHLLKNGYSAVFGLLAPDHDEYVKTKTGDFPIDRRAPLIVDAIKGKDWIGVDWWAAYFNNEAVNFTDILRRIHAQANHPDDEGEIDVFLVCGGDNARFALTFQNRGHCIIVGRGGYENKYTHLVDNKRIFYVDGSDNTSSTEIRKGATPWYRGNLVLRVDSQDWRELEIANILRDYYNHVEVRRTGEQFRKLLGAKNIISLDSMIPCKHNLSISRLYDGLGTYKLGHCSRVGSGGLDAQIRKIPKGSYALYDSDIFTGGTMDYAEEMLDFHDIKIIERRAFDKFKDGVEILDARDFILGHPNGGLTVLDERQEKTRVPYILPYVIPSVRASCHNSKEMSARVIEANQKFF